MLPAKYTNFHSIRDALSDAGLRVRMSYRAFKGDLLEDKKHRRVVIAEIYPADMRYEDAFNQGQVVIGTSKCSRKDQFKKYIGRDIALGRAYHELLTNYAIISPECYASRKSPAMQKFIEGAFNVDLNGEQCAFCASRVTPEMIASWDPDTRSEWRIARICSTCQDEIYDPRPAYRGDEV